MRKSNVLLKVSKTFSIIKLEQINLLAQLQTTYKVIHYKGLSIKDVRTQGGLSSADKGGSLDADVRTFWCKKTSDSSKFMVCPHEQGGGERSLSQPVRTFFGQGGGG